MQANKSYRYYQGGQVIQTNKQYCPIIKEECKGVGCAWFIPDHWDSDKVETTPICAVKIFLMRGDK